MEDASWVDLLLQSIISGLFVGVTVALVVSHIEKGRARRTLRQDVLRRLLGYSYRLTGSFKGTDGEPFVALNEAWIVFADCPRVTGALARMHDELGHAGRLAPNVVELVRSMADVADVPIEEVDENFLVRPFTPPRESSVSEAD